ncbi:hypothetical protein AB0E69_17035 [Kribbella sp. NPDC026611]|uniref:hypothetical protein n=1 Tax=Kribbella sp. NPDC026611 TaxID=3154911 RepID=UPI0033D34108
MTGTTGYRADLTTYATYGVWDEPWDQAAAPKADRNRQKAAERWAARETELGPRGADVLEQLTWEQFEANAPCPGCGLSVKGDPDTKWVGKPLMVLTAEERAARDAEDARFHAAHPNHQAARWAAGSVDHCCRCCPMPPMSPRRLEELRHNPVLRALWSREPCYDVMRWDVRWWCGCVTEERLNMDQKAYGRLTELAARRCPICAADPVVVVASRAAGLVGQPAPPPSKASPTRPQPRDRRTKAELVAEISELRDRITTLEAGVPGEPNQHSPLPNDQSE